MEKSLDVTAYITNYPKEVQDKLNKIRLLIQKKAPEAIEKISWGMPTYSLNGDLIHFAGYKHHIGIYPGPQAIEYFEKELQDYKTSKGTIQLPLDKEIPYDLIEKILDYRLEMSKKKQNLN